MPAILLIEDDDLLRRLAAKALSKEFDVIVAQTGEEGLQYAQEIMPDLILCDICLPDMDGFEILRSLRNQELTRTLPLIFITALNDRAEMRRGMTLGADDYLVKPFSVQELLQSIRATLRKNAERRAELEEMMESLRKNIATSIPHELRTAINVIRGYADLMSESLDENSSSVAPMLKHIREYSERIHNLSERYLWYINAEVLTSEEIQRSPTPKPDSIAGEIAQRLAQGYQREGDLQLNLQRAEIPMDPQYWGRIVEELTDNAFKFSEPGQAVAVESHLDGEAYVLSISSRGRSMTGKQVGSIGAMMQFERDEYEQQGTGMGLAIVNRLLGLANGSLNIEGFADRTPGTIVRLTLPILDRKLPNPTTNSVTDQAEQVTVG